MNNNSNFKDSLNVIPSDSYKCKVYHTLCNKYITLCKKNNTHYYFM